MEAHLSLSLPDQIVLLLHDPYGRRSHGGNHDAIISAAEVAELMMHGRAVLTRSALGRVKIGLLDRTPIGVEALDRPLSMLAGRVARKGGPIPFHVWLAERRGAFREQRWSLWRQGYLEYIPQKLLGFIPRDLYRPHGPLLHELIGELGQLARGGRPLDDRLALLVAIVYSSRLHRRLLRLDRWQSRRLKHIAKGHLLEGAVSAAVAATGVAVASTVGGVVGAGGEGDGGGE
ncbi:Golgi phosphoprotein 3 (GPP34) [Actinopolyspora xinjiangensis]|uniref:Golgi phosphoprotein 3 (GPP34) n=1 Tax=Actinopolyspora xinjiangensis TaxID=405564 RepID=A0A1H0VTE4_9ACTN|nr:GPP34 family phosphoprotein [Actinopolyspora xinjiangensis]SDP81521.1 Golgi phosphoprotein 3 (GPP34) [Actinopolyspora xinjiangensis]